MGRATTRVFVVACGRWVEVPVEEVREAVRAGAVFEIMIAPVVENCVGRNRVERRGADRLQ